MEYFSYRPDKRAAPCLQPDSALLADKDTVRLVMAPDSETPQPNCPLQIHEPTPTGHVYDGQISDWRWEGLGSLSLPSGVRYEGEFEDGRFHGTGTLHFPTGSKYEGQWRAGVCTNGLYTFADGLSFSNGDWGYCRYPDRRYWSEMQHGLKPAGRSQLADHGTPPHVPDGTFDVGDGFYDPNCRTVNDYGDPKKIRRVVTDQVHQWIIRHCRKGGDEFQGRRDELHQDVAVVSCGGGQSKWQPPLPANLRLEDILGGGQAAELASTPSQLQRQSDAADEAERAADSRRAGSRQVVQRVVQTAQRVVATVHTVVSSAAWRADHARQEARSLVDSVAERACSAHSSVSSLLEAARRRLASGSDSSSDWSSSSGDGSRQESEQRVGTRRRRSAYSAAGSSDAESPLSRRDSAAARSSAPAGRVQSHDVGPASDTEPATPTDPR